MHENRGFITICCVIWVCALAIVCFGDESTIGFLLTIFLLPTVIIGWVVLLAIAIFRLFSRSPLPWKKRLVPLWFLTVPLLASSIIGMTLGEIDKESTWLVIRMHDFRGSENFKFKKDGRTPDGEEVH